MNKRFGFTLIETLVSVSASGAILALACGLLYSLLKMDRTGREHLERRLTLGRLGADFRDDAHAAIELAPAEIELQGRKAAGWEFRFAQADRKVQYHAAAGRLVREEQAGGKVVRREAYRLPPGSGVSLERLAGPPPLASLRIAPGAQPGEPAGGAPVRIEAALASDHRFLQPKGGSK